MRSKNRSRKPKGSTMGCDFLYLNEAAMREGLIMLTKDKKIISRVQPINSPVKLPHLDIHDIKAAAKFDLSELPRFYLHPAFSDDHQKREWHTFTKFLQTHDRVARVVEETYVCYILPPDLGTKFVDAIVFYQMGKENKRNISAEAIVEVSTACMKHEASAPLAVDACAITFESSGESVAGYSRKKDAKISAASRSPGHIHVPMAGQHNVFEAKENNFHKQYDTVEKNHIRADPSYLRTLGQTHSGWVFGAIAELIDNSRDAKATKLDIFIQSVMKDGKQIPMLSVIDDGHGMSHQEILRMLSLGRKAPDGDDPDRIGRFGIGFKTGSMKIGRDVIVLTQTSKSRSIGFLSQSLNEGKDMLEIPIVSYCRQGPMMEFDTSVQTKATAEYNLKTIKEYSGFNEYYIGELFANKGIGTQIYIWNLDEWGSDYCLEWMDGKDTSQEGDVCIRSKRIRRRPGQISQKVPLDYSLRSYLEVIFLEPRMKIYVQNSLVKSRPLAKSLNETDIIKGEIIKKSVQLTLGRSQLEWNNMNSGIFLYWHGRLIEAYKRVGGMVHNADIGRGVIGVIDVTDLMNDGKDVWVHNDKQGFQDCEVYAKLEEWLGHRTDEYWDKHFDSIRVKKCNASYKPDHEWVQCDKCRKWRILSSGYDSKNLPLEWFCYMPPFCGKCEIPEQQQDQDVITVGAKRSGCDSKEKPALNDNSDCSSQTQVEVVRPLKKLRRGQFKKEV
ncbi:Morc family cw-type zinc finger protein [Thalictrum thalictroides]|uniref:Morc family cw-type zinc finger protein n=1 Tax=Thalictrum thalictroides TaxID=46969 RepID=A0A7J6X8I4_THATH|nr:Morc family cw-type zinc finger protein [Thalictrum thalictroides]